MISFILTSKILDNETHPTKWMDDDSYGKLKESIKQIGIAFPLIVRKRLDGYYSVVDGRHRLKVARELNLEEIPCIVLPEDVTPNELFRKMYDVEIYRKSYTKEEINHFEQQRDNNIRAVMDRHMSQLIQYGVPKEVIEKLVGDLSNSDKLIKILKKLDPYHQEKIKELEKKLEEAQSEKEQIKEEYNKLYEEFKETKSQLSVKEQKLKADIEKKIEEKVQQRIELFKSQMQGQVSEDIIKQIREEERKAIEAEYEEEIERLKEEQKEVNRNLVELSRKYKEAKDILENREREIKSLQEQLKINRNTTATLQETTKKFYNCYLSISPFNSILKKIILAHNEIEIATKEIEESFTFLVSAPNIKNYEKSIVLEVLGKLSTLIGSVSTLKDKVSLLEDKIRHIEHEEEPQTNISSN